MFHNSQLRKEVFVPWSQVVAVWIGSETGVELSGFHFIVWSESVKSTSPLCSRLQFYRPDSRRDWAAAATRFDS
jgi:hypothetical protein